jgi:DNA/RNA endonuclease YhcR with UshA esterase domain
LFNELTPELAGLHAPEHNPWMWLARFALCAAAIAIVVVLFAARKKAAVVSSSAAQMPAQITTGGQIADNGPYVVVNVNVSKARNAFLNIGGAYPNQTLTIFIAEADVAKFDVDTYPGKRIMVRGIITDDKGKLEIKVTDPNQIRIVP